MFSLCTISNNDILQMKRQKSCAKICPIESVEAFCAQQINFHAYSALPVMNYWGLLYLQLVGKNWNSCAGLGASSKKNEDITD